MNSKIVNKLSKFALINGVVCSLSSGTYMGYYEQKKYHKISDKMIGSTFGVVLGIIIGFPLGVLLTFTFPISFPVILYDKYNQL